MVRATNRNFPRSTNSRIVRNTLYAKKKNAIKLGQTPFSPTAGFAVARDEWALMEHDLV